MELAELSERFESSGYRGLHRFVLWLRSLAEKGREPALGAESASAVQIMSVHRSKGLEFPVVFLCDTARRFNKQDSRDTVLVHPELGLGPKVTDLERRVEYPSLARNAIKLRLERELLSEEMRLLYVALTRPKERLYVTAAVKDPEQMISKAAASVSVPMAPELLAQAAAPVNWLIYAGLAGRLAAHGAENRRVRRRGRRKPRSRAAKGCRRGIAPGASAQAALCLSFPGGGGPALQGHGNGAERPGRGG